MARRYINELNAGEHLQDQIFLVHAKDLRTTTQGSLYIHLVFVDRTGQLLGRIWQASEAMYQAIPEGGFLRVRGRAENYKGAMQFIVDGMQPVRPEDVDLSEFLPRTERDVDEMWAETKAILRTIKNPDLLLLIKKFVEDEPLIAAYKRAPAAMQLHHAYLGGLLEHTLNVLELGKLVCPRYPRLDRDLVMAGIFLHDIGKSAELSYDTSFAYSDRGQLVGHIVIASVWIEQKIAEIEAETGKPFPAALRDRLVHLVLAHHGKYEFGSPRLPAIPEAMLVHLLDNVDAKLAQYFTAIDADADPASNWTQFVRALDTRIFKGAAGVPGDRK